jgi:hypothetical protein
MSAKSKRASAKSKKPSTESSVTCAQGVCNPRLITGSVKQPNQGDTITLITLPGPGVFVSAQVAKQGGTNGVSFVNLELDGSKVVDISYDAAKNFGLTQYNHFGFAVLNTAAGVDNFTIGFSTPLRFEKGLVLSVKVNETDVVKITSGLVHGS